jgi:hypothetical protein
MASSMIKRSPLIARGPVLPLVFGAAAEGRTRIAGPDLRLTCH